MTSDAALMLLQKKKALKQEIVPDLDKMIENAVAATTERTKREIEEKLLAMKPRDPEVVKSDVTSLFKASEADFRILLEQRKKAMEGVKPATIVPGTKQAELAKNIYVDFTVGMPSPAATSPDDVIVEINEDKKNEDKKT
jgi:hypothetical protein